jgi:hypothetical protein
MTLRGTLLFHLNLSYSSIEVEEREAVVERCYRPILGLLERRPWLRLAVEASGHTLERVAAIDPDWIAALRRHVADGRVELVGSGDTQLIGPLVPAVVNRWNQRLGAEACRELVGRAPETALVSEMAWSQGLVDAYLDAGYRTLLMEWNNPRRGHPKWDDAWRYGAVETASPRGSRIGLLFVDAVAFQKFQRAAVGELDERAYCDWVTSHAAAAPRHLFLYASDAEVFDFRPGRYSSEPALPAPAAGREWPRIARIVELLHARGVAFTTPAAVRADPAFAPRAEVRLSTFADPIPVKKQPKYNVTRWALSGRDDVGLNRMCFARARALAESQGAGAEDWRELCRAWASDHRTHLTERRWEHLDRLAVDPPRNGVAVRALRRAEVATEESTVAVRTDGIELELDARRGLAITRLAAAGGPPVAGTLPHGYFDDIHWAADFYSGHTVVEVPARLRVTDLERVEPRVTRGTGWIDVEATVPTELGPLEKRVRASADEVRLAYGFAAWGRRPVGTLRTAFATLDPVTFGEGELWIECANGGDAERFRVEGACEQTGSVSALVSARGAFGATDGRLAIVGERASLELAWDPGRAAALPLVLHREVDGRRMFRVAFSLSEVDDTHREGALLYDFEVAFRPRAGGVAERRT